MTKTLKALPVGRLLRMLLGIVLAATVWPFFRDAEGERIFGALGIAVGLTLLYAALHRLVSGPLAQLNRWVGALLAVLPVGGVFLFGGGLGQVGALSFLAVSLILAAVRADAGCEVMSIPALFSGRRTHLVCLLFSPLDWVEEKIVTALRPSAGST